MNITSSFKAAGIAVASFVFGAVLAWQYFEVQRLPETPLDPQPPQLAVPVVEDSVPAPVASVAEVTPATSGTTQTGEHTVLSLLDVPGDFEQTRALYDLLGRADVERIKQHIADAELVRSPSDRRAALQVAYLKFSELDAQAALDHLLQSTNPAKETLLYVMFRNWEKFNPEFAISQVALLDDHNQKIASNGIMDAHDNEDVEALRRLLTQLPKGSTSERHIVSNIVENAMENPQAAIREALRLQSNQQRQSALIAIAQRWATNDQRAALAYRTNISGANNKKMYEYGLFSQIASQDAEALIKTLPQYTNTSTREMLVQAAFGELGQRHPKQAFRLADELTDLKLRTTALQQVLGTWVQRDPASAADALDELGDKMLSQLFNHLVVRSYTQRDPVAALEWAERTEGRRGNLWMQVLNTLAKEHPGDALALLESIDPSPERLDALSGLLGAVAGSDPGLAISHYENMPEGQAKANVAQAIVMAIAQKDPELAMEWALAMPTALQANLLNYLVHSVTRHGIEAALAYVEFMPTDELRDQWISGVINQRGSSDPRVTAKWLANYSDHPKYGSWVSSVAGQLAQEDHVEALALIGELEGGEHYQLALNNVLSTWATKDGKAAANYVGKLRQVENRPQLVRKVTSAWFRYDPRGAERWVMGLNHSDERDSGLMAMLENAQYLEDAQRRRMLDRLSSEQKRSEVVFNFVQQLVQYDLDEARAWLNSSYLNEDQRLQMEQMIDRQESRTRVVH